MAALNGYSAVIARRMHRADQLQERFRTSTGNVLAYRRRVHPDPEAPTFVLVNCLMATAELWSWVADGLASEGTVVTYDPAGYGSSRLARGVKANLSVRQADLTDLVRRFSSERVVLVGHSVGGHVVREVARTGDVSVDGLVLIDPSHPQELDRSPRQKIGAERIEDSLKVAMWGMCLGLESLVVQRSRTTPKLPDAAHQAVALKRRHRGIWITGLQEWESFGDLLAKAAPVPPTRVPTLVITAEETANRDNDMVDMHSELVSVTSGRHVTLPGTHETILADQDNAHTCVAQISEFVTSLIGGHRVEHEAAH